MSHGSAVAAARLDQFHPLSTPGVLLGHLLALHSGRVHLTHPSYCVAVLSLITPSPLVLVSCIHAQEPAELV